VLISSVGLFHTLWSFRNSRSFRGGGDSPTTNPQLGEDQELHFVLLYPLTYLARLALPGAYAPASITLQITGKCKPHLHDMAVVHEEYLCLYYTEILYTTYSHIWNFSTACLSRRQYQYSLLILTNWKLSSRYQSVTQPTTCCNNGATDPPHDIV
jgi:hypothetical protein